VAEVLSRRALTRALLARQLLLYRERLPALDALERVVGLQHQERDAAYFGLWSRLQDFDQRELTGLLEERRSVRGGMMRATQHVVSARDFVVLRPVVQPALDRAQRSLRKQLAGVDLDELIAVAKEALRERPRTGAEGRALLSERWPDHDRNALWYSVHFLVPLVTVPPGGTWGVGGHLTSALAEDWLGRPIDAEAAPDELLLRYLAAFGPATIMDAQSWTGLTRLAAAAERHGDRLRRFRDEDGRELVDLPDAPRPDPDTPAPVRFLPPFDNAIQGHAERGRILPDEHRPVVVGGIAAVLVDGEVAGSWRLDGDDLRVRTFAVQPRAVRDELSAEGERLLAFAGRGGDVRLEVGTNYLN
jgi:Winged helix DNA-binding domain